MVAGKGSPMNGVNGENASTLARYGLFSCKHPTIMRNLLLCLSILIIATACGNSPSPGRTGITSSFANFEISYNDVIHRLHLRVDSNGIYHASGAFDLIYYGEMPLDQLAAIDTILESLRLHNPGDSPSIGSHEPRLSILAVVKNDTTRIIRGSDIDTGLTKQVLKLADFVKNRSHSSFRLTDVFETAQDVYDLPPPVK